mmetsp:Transcript_145264/g.253470  ORF Transcript_145264/g.253470 Transcript_145264/m.253470 type:complete len:83 (-) Transcript_145264:2780-3028(-)
MVAVSCVLSQLLSCQDATMQTITKTGVGINTMPRRPGKSTQGTRNPSPSLRHWLKHHITHFSTVILALSDHGSSGTAKPIQL